MKTDLLPAWLADEARRITRMAHGAMPGALSFTVAANSPALRHNLGSADGTLQAHAPCLVFELKHGMNTTPT